MKLSKNLLAGLVCGLSLIVAPYTASAQQADPNIRTVAYQGAGHRFRQGMRNTGDALGVTPAIKSAILADKGLNNRRNHINVNTRDSVVHLKGHVYSGALRTRAVHIAVHELSVLHKHYRVSNELSVVR